MSRPGSGTLISGGLVAGFGTVVSLVLPWFDLLGQERSSVDLLRSASALEVIDGGVRIAVIAGWLLMPVLLTVAIFLGAARRYRLAAGILLPITALTLLVAGVGVAVDEIGLAWGAFIGSVCALIAAALAMMVLLAPAGQVTARGVT